MQFDINCASHGLWYIVQSMDENDYHGQQLYLCTDGTVRQCRGDVVEFDRLFYYPSEEAAHEALNLYERTHP